LELAAPRLGSEGPYAMLVRLGLCLATCVFSGCTPVVPPVTAEMFARARATEPTLSQADLESGRALYVGRCGSCHALPRLSDKSAADWPEVVDTMATKSKLNEAQRRNVLRYVLAAHD
jgi:mono/diheme cytochrome c family protein